MRLLILRHAKSSWGHPGLSDKERPLNERGKRDAPQMAQVLLSHAVLPQRILCSTAVRTRQTVAYFKDVLPQAELSFHDELYHAGPRDLLDAVRMHASDCDTVMLVAHNPGVTYLLNELSDSRIDNVPTCGLGCVELPNDELIAVRPQGSLEFFVYPKGLD